LEFEAHCQVKTAIKSADMNKLYIEKAIRHNPEIGQKGFWMNISWREMSWSQGARLKASIQRKRGGG
jgi:hypothetical protein